MRLIDRGLEAILMDGGGAAGLSLAAGLAGVAALGVAVPELVERLRELPVFHTNTDWQADILLGLQPKLLGGGRAAKREMAVSAAARARAGIVKPSPHASVPGSLASYAPDDPAGVASRLVDAGVVYWPATDAERAVAADALMEANHPLGECVAIRLANRPYLLIKPRARHQGGPAWVGSYAIALLDRRDNNRNQWSPSDFRDSVAEAFDYTHNSASDLSEGGVAHDERMALFWDEPFVTHVKSLRRDKR